MAARNLCAFLPWALLGLGCCIGASRAAGVDRADRPSSGGIPTTVSAVRLWVNQNARLNPNDVVFIGTGYLLALKAGVGGEFLLREEVSDEALVKRLGGRSAEAYVEFDCDRQLTKIQSASVFQAAGALGQGQSISPEALLSSSPDVIFDLPRAACDTAFHRPLGSGRLAARAAREASSAGRRVVLGTSDGSTSGSVVAERARWIQVGAFGSRGLASAAMRRISNALASGGLNLPVRLSEASSHPGDGARVGVLIGPLSDTQDRKEICQRMQSLNLGCIIRRSP